MTTTRKPRQPRPAAPAAAAEPATPATPPDPQAVLLQAALEVLGLEALPASCAELAKAVGPAPPSWSWDQARGYSLCHRLLTDRATARRLAKQQQPQAPGET